MKRINPITSKRVEQQSKAKKFGFASSIDGFKPREIVDSEELKRLFSSRQHGFFVPFAGTINETGHGLLAYYDNMYTLSPTRNACINSKKEFLFNGKMRVVKSSGGCFDDGAVDKEIAPPDVIKRLNEIFCPSPIMTDKINRVTYGADQSLLSIICNFFEGIAKNGNGNIHLALTESLGERSFGMQTIQQRKALFDITDYDYPRTLAISPIWQDWYLRKHPASRIELFPHFVEDKLGTQHTIIRQKHGDATWYGRPSDDAAWINWYREWQDQFYLARLTENEFVGKHILEAEAGKTGSGRIVNDLKDQAAGFKNTHDRWAKNWSNQSSDPSTFILLTRPFGTKPMSYFSVQPNTNEDYYKVNEEINKHAIMKAQNWTPELLGESQGAFSMESVTGHMKVKSVSSFPFLTAEVMEPINLACKIGLDWIGEKDLLDYDFDFVSPLEKLQQHEAND